MKRRDFLLSTAALSAASGSLLRGAPAPKRPNLLIIHTDEQNFRTLGCYRERMSDEQAHVWGPGVKVETPHIDALAKEGATCTRFYATTPVCSPSRGVWVSGQYPQHTPVTNNNIHLSDDLVTFAEILRREGYATGYAGKWHLDGTGKPQWGPERKFGFTDNRYMFNRGHWKKFEDTDEGPRVAARDKKGRPSYAVDGADEKSFATDWLADKAIAFAREQQGKPFCYMLSIPDPHGPNSVRAPYDTMYESLDFQPPKTMVDPGETVPTWGKGSATKLNNKSMARYFGMVKCVDDNVGKIVSALKELGVFDDTIVIFTADHGDMCGEHRRHNKGIPYEASARIPFVLRYPPKVKAGMTIDATLSCVDFLPTILGLMSQKTAGREEGLDGSFLFDGGAPPRDWSDMVFFRSTTNKIGAGGHWLAATDGRYKLILADDDQPWLFDLEQDPDEVINRFEEPKLREIASKLGKGLLAYHAQHNDPYVDVPSIKADLEWCATGEGSYQNTKRG